MSLWTAPVPPDTANTFDFEPPSKEELAKLAKDQLEDEEFQRKMKKRLAPYRTKVDWRRVRLP